MNLVIAVLVTFLLLTSTEWLWRAGHVQKEYARKLVHMSVGTFVAFWPFFLSWNQIRLLSIAFIIVVTISLKLRIFKSIHSVERPSWGEVMFAVAVGLLTFITHDPYIYAVAIAHMSLADGAAALVGTRYGRTNGYRIFGQFKSRAGSIAFFIVSLALVFGYVAVSGTTFSVAILVLLPITATLAENAGWRGLDNITVPVIVVALLRLNMLL